MSRKPRKRKKRPATRRSSAPASRLTTTAQTLRKRGGVAAITGGIVLLAGLLLVAALVFSGSQPPTETTESFAPLIPAPDTGSMEGPVRRRLEQARTTVERQPDSGPAWGGYGALCDAHSLYECAEVCYTRATELDKSDFRWFYLLGFVSELRGAPADRVAAHYERAALLEPRLPTTFYRLGEVLTRAGRLDEASVAYNRAIAIDTQLTVAYRGLGQVALAQGDPDAAIVHLNRAMALGADRNPATLASLAQAQMRVGDGTAAEATAARAATATAELPIPDPVRLRINEMNLSSAESASRAARLIQAGRYEAALEQMRVVEESRPDEPVTHYRIGVCLANLGQLDEALPRLRRAAELVPDNEIVRREFERVRDLVE